MLILGESGCEWFEIIGCSRVRRNMVRQNASEVLVHFHVLQWPRRRKVMRGSPVISIVHDMKSWSAERAMTGNEKGSKRKMRERF